MPQVAVKQLTSGSTGELLVTRGGVVDHEKLKPDSLNGPTAAANQVLFVVDTSTFGTDNAFKWNNTDKTVDLSGGVAFTERADHPGTPAPGKGILWVKSDTPNVIMFTDDAGTDHDLSGGGLQAEGTQYAIPRWTDAGGQTLGASRLTDDGTDLVVGTDPDDPSDANALLKLGSAEPSDFAAAVDTDGMDAYFKGQSGGVSGGANPDGGSFIFEPGAKGASGAGADGRLIVRQPGGVAGSDDLSIYNDGSFGKISSPGGAVISFKNNQSSLYLLATNVFPGNDGNVDFGHVTFNWRTAYVRGLGTGTGQVFSLVKPGQLLGDTNTFLRFADTEPGDFCAATTVSGMDAYFKGQSGGVSGGANPDGGSFVFEPGALGYGGAGADGRFVVRQPGGVAGTDDLRIRHDGTDGEIDTLAGDLFLNPTGSVKFGTHAAIGAETVTGYITVKDAAGNSRKLAVVS